MKSDCEKNFTAIESHKKVIRYFFPLGFNVDLWFGVIKNTEINWKDLNKINYKSLKYATYPQKFYKTNFSLVWSLSLDFSLKFLPLISGDIISIMCDPRVTPKKKKKPAGKEDSEATKEERRIVNTVGL